MNIFEQCELTDAESARTRYWSRLIWCAFGLPLALAMNWDSLRLILLLGIFMIAYVPIGGYAYDLWRLRCPSRPLWLEAVILLSLPVPVFAVMFLLIRFAG